MDFLIRTLAFRPFRPPMCSLGNNSWCSECFISFLATRIFPAVVFQSDLLIIYFYIINFLECHYVNHSILMLVWVSCLKWKIHGECQKMKQLFILAHRLVYFVIPSRWNRCLMFLDHSPCAGDI